MRDSTTIQMLPCLHLFTVAYKSMKTMPHYKPANIRPVIQITWELELAKVIRKQARNRSRSYVIAVVGIPGSGKSTGAEILASLCGDECLCIPFDGYHHSVDTLKSMPNSQDLIYRRGAPDTFDPDRLLRDLERIRYGNERQVFFPGYDHADGDPEPNCHTFDRNKHRVVVVEGLYLLHDQDGWERIKNCFDLTVYVDADANVCMDRLKVQNKKVPGYSPEEIESRVDAVDRVNAKIVERSNPKRMLLSNQLHSNK